MTETGPAEIKEAAKKLLKETEEAVSERVKVVNEALDTPEGYQALKEVAKEQAKQIVAELREEHKAEEEKKIEREKDGE